VFTRARLVVFCDGDFWHGKDWEARKAKLEQGTNPRYWVAKIESNIARDLRYTTQLEADGWTVLRVWESDVHHELEAIIARVLDVLDSRGHRHA
jgi:DNA mismatch endonuclease (patch repair protein)